jgi:hypothetical protein
MMPEIQERLLRSASGPSRYSHKAEPVVKPSLDEWILGMLDCRGSQGLEHLAGSLGEVNWSELFLALERLRRAGDVLLWPSATGDVVLSLGGKRDATSDVRRQDATALR